MRFVGASGRVYYFSIENKIIVDDKTKEVIISLDGRIPGLGKYKLFSEEIEQLKRRIESIRVSQIGDETLAERLAQIQETIDQREKNKGTYDDAIVRQMVECIQVHKDGKLTIIFGGGYEVEERL